MRKLKELKIKYEYVESGDNQQRLDNAFDFIFSKIFENKDKKGLYNNMQKNIIKLG